MRTDLLLLTPLARLADFGLFLLRLVTGAFLVWQRHDNVLSAARRDEFEKFLVQFGFPMPACSHRSASGRSSSAASPSTSDY
jgi:putative oxidoreductase